MWKRLILTTIAGSALGALGGCADTGYSGYSAPGYSAPSNFTPSSTIPRDREKPRGNTPVGMDRTGAGPADGAILDPSGAVTKEPVLRDR